MKNICESAWIFAVLVLFLMFLTPFGLNANVPEGFKVGRVSALEPEVQRYVPESNERVLIATDVTQAPPEPSEKPEEGSGKGVPEVGSRNNKQTQEPAATAGTAQQQQRQQQCSNKQSQADAADRKIKQPGQTQQSGQTQQQGQTARQSRQTAAIAVKRNQCSNR